MRHFVYFFLLCTIAQAETQPSRNFDGKLFDLAKPVLAVSDNVSEKQVIDIPVAEDVVFPAEFLFAVTIQDLPAAPWFIVGKGESKAEQLAYFLLNENNSADPGFVEALAAFYVTEAEIEGINHDVAFAQMCLETGFLRFGGLVSAEMNNFCGLGAIGPGENGLWFSTAELGVRAHIQHLKAYANEEPLIGELIDPRFRFVRRGSSPILQGLSGTWAADKMYADKIELILDRLFRFTDQ